MTEVLGVMTEVPGVMTAYIIHQPTSVAMARSRPMSSLNSLKWAKDCMSSLVVPLVPSVPYTFMRALRHAKKHEE